MRASHWKQQSRRVVRQVVAECKQQGVTDEVEILRRVDAAYPFGERAYWPYKCWLAVRAELRRSFQGDGGTYEQAGLLVPVPEIEEWLKARV